MLFHLNVSGKHINKLWQRQLNNAGGNVKIRLKKQNGNGKEREEIQLKNLKLMKFQPQRFIFQKIKTYIYISIDLYVSSVFQSSCSLLDISIYNGYIHR